MVHTEAGRVSWGARRGEGAKFFFRGRNVPRTKNLFLSCNFQGRKKQHKHKCFGPDFPRTFLTLTPERPGVKKFLLTTGAAGKRTFWCGRPRFSARTSMTRRVVEKLCTKKVCVDFLAPKFVYDPILPIYCGGGGKRVDLSFCFFPGFVVFGGPKIPRCWEKQHEECRCHTLSCVPQVLVKTRAREQSPQMLTGKGKAPKK